MDQLCEILIHKLKLIVFNPDYKTMTVEQKDQLLDNLLIEKKKQSLRVLVESRLQHVVASRHYCSDEEIREVMVKSYAIMVIRVHPLKIDEQKQPLNQLVDLYRCFFDRVGGSSRVQEIDNMFCRRLCPKTLIPGTLFSWFVEWTKRQFREFLKVNIHSLYVNSRQPFHSVHSEKEKKEREESEGPLGKIVDPFMIIKRKSVLTTRPTRESKQNERNDRKQLPRSLQELRIGSPLNKSERKLDSLLSPPRKEAGPINRQVFLYAFAQQFQTQYKILENCIPDLDISWARRLKRGSRKAEVLRRIDQVASSCILHMTHVKELMEQYLQSYEEAHGNCRKKIEKSKRRSMKTESMEIQEKKLKTEVQEQPIKKRRKKQKKEYLEEQIQKPKIIRKYSVLDSQQSSMDKPARMIATSEYLITDQRQQLLSSLSRKSRNRYNIDSNYESESNLMPSPTRQSRRSPRNVINYEMSHKTIDFNIGQHDESSKILWMNSGRSTGNDLQIIEERVKKMKMKVLNGRPMRGSVINLKGDKKRKKGEVTKSLDLRSGKGIEYRSLPVTYEISEKEKEKVKLPKIKKSQ